jgi:hypothetical protein
MKAYVTFWGVPKRQEGPEIVALFPVKFVIESLWNLLLVTEDSLIILHNMCQTCRRNGKPCKYMANINYLNLSIYAVFHLANPPSKEL